VGVSEAVAPAARDAALAFDLPPGDVAVEPFAAGGHINASCLATFGERRRAGRYLLQC
jgi:hypothetical protein